MTREDVTNGQLITLLARQGLIDCNEAVDSLKEQSGLSEIDIGFVNQESDRGIVYIDQNGQLLEQANEDAERAAVAKIIPTGYFEKTTYYPLCALLFKDGTGWTGVIVGNCHNLYNQAAKKLRFKGNSTMISNSLRGYIDIRGAGWKAIQEYNDKSEERFNGKEVEISCDVSIIEAYDNERKREREMERAKASKVSTNKTDDIKSPITDIAPSTSMPSVPSMPSAPSASMTIPSASVSVADSKQVDEGDGDFSLVPIWRQIYNNLLIKDCWNSKNLGDLEDYIKHLYKKVCSETSSVPIKPRGNGYLLSEDAKTVCINTGLLDTFGNDVLITTSVNDSISKMVRALKLVTCKLDLINLRFRRCDIVNPPKPIKFYRDRSELIFSGKLEDFDLDSISKLKHVVTERKFRLPKKYSDMATEAIAQMIKNSVVQGFRIATRDYRYFVPMYNFERGQIQFLVPIYLDGRLIGEPDVVGIIGQSSGFYTLNTIITIEDAKNNARLLTIPGGIWLDS